MNPIDLVGMLGALLAGVLTYLQIKSMRAKRAQEHELAILKAHGAPEQKVSVLVNSAEAAVVLLRSALERADAEIVRKDAVIQDQYRQLAELRRRIEELERAAR